jgi:nucleotide-binding universal stress UspA family protein
MSKNQVVVAYDFSATAEIALQQAVDLACKDPTSTLHFLTAVDSKGDYRTAERIQQDLLDHVQRALDVRRPDRDVEFYVHARIGPPVAVILELAAEVGADLVIVGSHGRGAMGRFLLGSVSEGVLHGSRCPVMVARAKQYAQTAPAPSVDLHRYSYLER